MRYGKVYLEALGVELAPVVVTSTELEARLEPLYRKLHLSPGQVEFLTGIGERRWWEAGFPVAEGARRAAREALERCPVDASDLGALIYAGVCRADHEPATACDVAAGLGLPPRAQVQDISNACLGVMNGVFEIANRIELGQIRAGMVVACETAREIVELTLEEMIEAGTMEHFTTALATLTGGSGAAAVILSDGSFSGGTSPPDLPRLRGGVMRTAPEHHDLSRWGVKKTAAGIYRPYMYTRSAEVLKHGVDLGVETWNDFLQEMQWSAPELDRLICHQVGSGHRDTFLSRIGVSAEKDFSTFPFLGNTGTVAIPLTASLAQQRGLLRHGDRVAFLGIGSGLNCLMLGWEW